MRKVFLVLFVGWFSLVTAESFAALTITPAGQQVFDLATGVTTLPQGGEIVDRESKLSLNAAHIRYEEGNFIEASESTVRGKFGTLQAADIVVNLIEQTILATGSLQFDYSGLSVVADSLTIYLEPDIAVLEGRVTSDAPQLSSATVVIDLTSQHVLLVSPYLYQNGILRLTQDAEGEFLQLDQTGTDDAPSYQARTQVDELVFERLNPFMP